jgi:hypothetical protein
MTQTEGVQVDTWSFEGAAVRFVLFTAWYCGEQHCKDEDVPELYMKIQSVPRSKHTPSQLYKPVS